VKTEADSNDITVCSRDNKPTIGMFGYSLQSDISRSLSCFSSKCFYNLSFILSTDLGLCV